MPDEELQALGESGKLLEPAILEAQARRLLAHAKAKALTDRFAVHWLQLQKLDSARPSTEYFPAFNGKLRQAMKGEVVTFVDRLREEDRSVLEFLDADYSYVNEDLARHYKIPGVKGPELRKVALPPDAHRGGLLGMGAILALTSHTHRTSPTLRGKWVLDVLFGTPPPPPPPDAGMLKEDGRKGKEPRTFRELMGLHAQKASCAACHQKIDPLGFALENFNAVGEWREGGDTVGVLPSGERFNGFEELRRGLLVRRGIFVRNLVDQLLGYALGRDLVDDDEAAAREIQAALEKDGDRFSTLVMGVVRSFPFTHRKGMTR